MKFPDANMVTPIYIKTKENMPWPREETFYLLCGNGLFLCRNHPFFRSCVPADAPCELARHNPFLHLRYPRIPRSLLEEAVGFFAAMGATHGAEAALMLIWDKHNEKVRLMAPSEICRVYETSHGDRYPVGLQYELPQQLPEGWMLFGDIHSHVDGSAYASQTDKLDEMYRPGLHIVVGRIREEPPEFHVEAMVDGVRFKVKPDKVLEGYARRRTDVCNEWFEKADIELRPFYQRSWNSFNEMNNPTPWADCDGPGEACKNSAYGRNPKSHEEK